MKKKLVFLSLASLLLFTLFLGCNSTTGEGFAIYLTLDNVPVADMEKLSHVDIADTSFISTQDIVSYDWAFHKIELTSEAYGRVRDLAVPMNGVSFVVCVDGSPVYWGAFWTMYSSQSYYGVVIALPLFSEMVNTIEIGYGYPGLTEDSINDPRSNTTVYNALEAAGKLK